MKNCIIISTNFPPTGGIGVQRVTKIAKYLPEYDINPIVVTVPVSSSKRSTKDISMLNEVNKNLEIHRPFFIDYRKFFPGDITKLFDYFFYPDKYKIWCYFALKKIKNICKEKKIEAIFITVKSFSLLTLIKPIKETLGIPVIVDFRDPFSFNFYNVNKSKKIREKMITLEKEAFQFADSVTIVTPYIADKYKELYPDANINTITNGFDPMDFPKKKKFEDIYQLKEFCIGYSGTFSKMVPLDVIVKVLINIYEEHKISIKLNIATPIPLESIKKKHPKLIEYDLINYFGFLPHKESIAKLYESQLLLFMLIDDIKTEGVYSGKILEYFNIPRPILFLNRKGSSLSDLIEKTKKGYTVDINNEQEITTTVLNLYRSWKNKDMKYNPTPEEILKFSYNNLTKNIAGLIKNAIVEN